MFYLQGVYRTVTVSIPAIRVIFIHLLSAFSAEIELRVKILMLKLVCGQNFVLLGYSGHELQRLENLVFSKFIWNCRCSHDVYTACSSIFHTNVQYSKIKFLKLCNSCLESNFLNKFQHEDFNSSLHFCQK